MKKCLLCFTFSLKMVSNSHDCFCLRRIIWWTVRVTHDLCVLRASALQVKVMKVTKRRTHLNFNKHEWKKCPACVTLSANGFAAKEGTRTWFLQLKRISQQSSFIKIVCQWETIEAQTFFSTSEMGAVNFLASKWFYCFAQRGFCVCVIWDTGRVELCISCVYKRNSTQEMKDIHHLLPFFSCVSFKHCKAITHLHSQQFLMPLNRVICKYLPANLTHKS